MMQYNVSKEGLHSLHLDKCLVGRGKYKPLLLLKNVVNEFVQYSYHFLQSCLRSCIHDSFHYLVDDPTYVLGLILVHEGRLSMLLLLFCIIHSMIKSELYCHKI